MNKIETKRLLKKQLRLGLKIIQYSKKIKKGMTYEEAWKVSSNTEQIAYDLSRTIKALNEQFS